MKDNQHIPNDLKEGANEIFDKVIALLDSFEGKYTDSVIAMTLVSVGVGIADRWKEGAGVELLKHWIKTWEKNK